MWAPQKYCAPTLIGLLISVATIWTYTTRIVGPRPHFLFDMGGH